MNDEPPISTPAFRALQSDDLTLHLIEETDIERLEELIDAIDERDYFLKELHKSYRPDFDNHGRRIRYGFYSEQESEVVGLSLLVVSSWEHRRGYTGADTFPHMRGQRIAPRSKPHLFYLAFELLHLNRVETGCLVSNESSRRSIEKTPGFVFEGTLREYSHVGEDQYEDELRWAILRRDWLKLYDPADVRVIR